MFILVISKQAITQSANAPVRAKDNSKTTESDSLVLIKPFQHLLICRSLRLFDISSIVVANHCET